MDFDPDAAAAPGSGIYGLPHGPDDALVHVLGVPYEATTSYRGGTSYGPEAVLAASQQVDLYDLMFGRPYEAGLWMAPVDGEIRAWSEEARALAGPIIERGGAGAGDVSAAARVDALGGEVNERVRAWTAAALEAGKLPALVGGDHSTPYGGITAAAAHVAAQGRRLAVLQFDAHADLRVAYEGFRWSHASILHNVLEGAEQLHSVTQVGIRDLGLAERERIDADTQVYAVFDVDLDAARFDGRVRELARETIAGLPDDVWITFDVDALDPALCPNTGTPVPNGLRWDEAMVWLEALARSSRRIVGLDLNEVSPGPDWRPGDDDTWDAMVGARLLYRLVGAALAARS